MTTCNSCGATYEPLQPGGLRYFHQCPFLSDADAAAALGLSDDPAAWSPADRVAIARAARNRPDARNENPPAYAPAFTLIEGQPVAPAVDDWRVENARRDREVISDGTGTSSADDGWKGTL